MTRKITTPQNCRSNTGKGLAGAFGSVTGPCQVVSSFVFTARGYPTDKPDLEHLLRRMIHPDPSRRITAMQTYHHRALQPSSPSVIMTPHFVRTAASIDLSQDPLPARPEMHQVRDSQDSAKSGNGMEKRRKPKQVRAATPTALGESIKQHTSVQKPARGVENAEKGAGVVIKQSTRKLDVVKREEQEITRTFPLDFAITDG